jgi:hypothetical protein
MTYDNGDVVESTTIVFECEVVGGDLEPQDDETATLQFRPVDELPELLTKTPAEIYDAVGQSSFFEWRDEWIVT